MVRSSAERWPGQSFGTLLAVKENLRRMRWQRERMHVISGKANMQQQG